MVGNPCGGLRCLMVLLYITWALLIQHVPSATSQLRQYGLTHSPCLQLKPWGPPQMCCGFGAARQLGWCVSPGTLPERVLAVLCGQEKHSWAAKLVSHYGHCLLLHLHKLGRERNCNKQEEFVCLMFILHQPRRVLGTTARATRDFTNCFKCCIHLLLLWRTDAVNIYSFHLLDFESESDFLHPYCLAHTTKAIFLPSYWSFNLVFPFLPCGCSLADECLRWGECCLVVEKWPWAGASCGGVCSSLCCRTAKGNKQSAKLTEKAARRGRLSHSFFLQCFSWTMLPLSEW